VAKRSLRPEPITFEEIASSPSLRGFDEFLRYRPGDTGANVIPIPKVGPESEPTVGLESEPTVGPGLEPTVGLESEPTVGAGSEPTVGPESEPTVLMGGLFVAENLGVGLFPATRVKRIELAQDALTAKEEAVYKVLWKSRDDQGVSAWSYTDLASHKDIRSERRNAAKLVRRLVQKGFIEIVRQGGGAPTQKTLYRALGYGTVLQTQKQRGVCGFIKTGNGVFYAIKAAILVSTVGSGSGPTVGSGSGPTVDRSSRPTVDRRCLPSLLVNKELVKASSSFEALVAATPDFDDDARSQLLTSCREAASDTTEAEIAEFTQRKRMQLLAGRKQIDNIVGLLLTAVPKCFEGQTLQHYRAEKIREEERAAAEARRQEAFIAEQIAEYERTLADPMASEEDRAFAREGLALLKTG
jgi:hypothetical protein